MDNKYAVEQHTNTKQEPYIRLLACYNCKTLEKLPSYDGPEDKDVTLQITLERHGEEHRGRIFNVAVLHWESETLRKEIIKQIWGGSSGLEVFGEGFYETRDTFQEDAMKCWSQHLRPKDGCREFRDESKRLLPGTDAARRELGLSSVKDSVGPKVYLCDFCPVRSVLARKVNEKRGIV